ncbi:hypothetical protein GCM10009765_23550 [Fodinicola feengrottensis]|uniref:Uncharacterized protein n=1 Tax=Fodinicola feengrottensis TaxID=435914 RepID=A0ABN2GNM0_9ACTN
MKYRIGEIRNRGALLRTVRRHQNGIFHSSHKITIAARTFKIGEVPSDSRLFGGDNKIGVAAVNTTPCASPVPKQAAKARHHQIATDSTPGRAWQVKASGATPIRRMSNRTRTNIVIVSSKTPTNMINTKSTTAIPGVNNARAPMFCSTEPRTAGVTELDIAKVSALQNRIACEHSGKLRFANKNAATRRTAISRTV